MIHEITDENFQTEVAQSTTPCLITFTAGWCTLCDDTVPLFETLAADYGDRVKFCIVNIDQQKALRIKFAVAALPYIVFIRGGQKTALFDEIVTESRLRERLEFMLAGGQAPNTRPL